MERTTTSNKPNIVAENKARRHYPKASSTFLEVLENTAKVCGTGEALAARIVKAFLNEVGHATSKYGRLTIPEAFEVFVVVQAEKQNNIKKAERFGKVSEIVPEHYVVRVKPHIGLRKRLRAKSTNATFLPKPSKAKE